MNEKKKEVKEVVVREDGYVSSKDAWRSIVHNTVQKAKDPETYKKAGKRVVKVLVLAGIGYGVSKGADALVNKKDDEWTDDVIDGDAEIIDTEDTEVAESTDGIDVVEF